MPIPVAPDPDESGNYAADVVVVGAGVAGLLAAARLAPHLEVMVVDKGMPGESGSSPWAQGGMAVALGPDDSPELHALDTEIAGDGLCDPAAVRVLTYEAPDRVRELLRLGAELDVEKGGDPSDPADLHLAREGGQRVARSVHRADATGAELVRVLRDAASGAVTRLAGTAFALDHDHAGVHGLWVHHRDQGVVGVRARAVLLATGGCGGLYAATTNQPHATGDGVALAWLAGAAVRDLEFVQFHPTGLAIEGTLRFLLTEALRGVGATLHDADGKRFMVGRHPDAELAPRHVVAKAILDQPGGAWLDATHLGEEELAREFPTVLAGARRHGFDLARDRVPVTPAAHYMVGGVRTDLQGRSSLAGLYAAGEVASTGVHGANRMAGNSLSEALVFGGRVAEVIRAEIPERGRPLGERPTLAQGPAIDQGALADIRLRLQTAMLDGAGPVRDVASLTRAETALVEVARELGPAAADATHLELTLAMTAASLIVESAVRRTESRGGHWRLDHPDRSSAWDGFHLERVRERSDA